MRSAIICRRRVPRRVPVCALPVAEPLGNRVLQPLYFGIHELDDLSRFGVDQMVMMWAVG